ncbi:hypothetical protein ABIA33_000530 [Streptacidiphilus sp. MAP12-16]|uniref:lantibiotic dehydratase C-terminal domain-containing protein n=1 Tax=Streptacidiphilus sp. MAP12-16 TaxID=3156300 RepID=UPI003516FBF2
MTTDFGSEPDDTAGAWQAFHIFYAASPRPLLLQCVEPLIDELTAEGLLAGHFFINYWMEGPHVRLRLRPSSPDAAAPVRERAEQAIAEFLRKRPALYEMPPGYLDEYYDKLFDLEYSPDQRERMTGSDGRMRLRANNTFSTEEYEPEYAKYGGPAGVALAEWHFRHSSGLVLTANRTLNLHLRTVALGFSAQLMMVMSGCLLADDDLLLDFFERYYAYWDGASASPEATDRAGFDRVYETADASPASRFRRILEAVGRDDFASMPGTLRLWAEHCRELRERVLDLTRRGELLFDGSEGQGGVRVTAPELTLPRLLVPYMHMTNNRLSMTIQDEAYLAFILARSLRESRMSAS